MITGPSGSSSMTRRSMRTFGCSARRAVTSRPKPTRSTASASPAGTRWRSAQAMTSDPARRSSALRSPAGAVGSSERSEFEHTSSHRSGVRCAGDIAAGFISISVTRRPRSASCQAASEPASPAPITWTSGRRTLFHPDADRLLLAGEPFPPRVAAPFLDAPDRDPAPELALDQERRAAARAGLGDRQVPGHEVALRLGVVRAAVEGLAAPRPLGREVAAAALLGAGDADRHRLGPLALRVARAGEELAEAAALHQHLGATDVALLVGGLLLDDLERAVGEAQELLRVLALGVVLAREERAVAAPLDDHRAAAL